MPGSLLGWRECNKYKRKKYLARCISYPFFGSCVRQASVVDCWSILLIVDQYFQSTLDQNSIDILTDPRLTKQRYSINSWSSPNQQWVNSWQSVNQLMCIDWHSMMCVGKLIDSNPQRCWFSVNHLLQTPLVSNHLSSVTRGPFLEAPGNYRAR